MVREDFLEEKGGSEALKAAECDTEDGKGGMFGEMVTVWVEEGSGWDYPGGNLLAPWKVGLTFRSDRVFQVEVGGTMCLVVEGCLARRLLGVGGSELERRDRVSEGLVEPPGQATAAPVTSVLRLEPRASYARGESLPLSRIPSLQLKLEWVLHRVDRGRRQEQHHGGTALPV